MLQLREEAMSVSVIFSFVKVIEESMVASTRIARFIRDTLGLPTIIHDDVISEIGPIDNLIIIGGAYAFAGSDVLAALGKAIESAGRVVWVQNDFTVIPPKDVSGAESPFRKAFRNRHAAEKPSVDYWTTVLPMSKAGTIAKSGHRLGERSAYVNWNCLTTRDDIPFTPFSERSDADALLYYGAFRDERTKYFDRYFLKPAIRTVISSPTKKFAERYAECEHLPRISDFWATLGSHGLGLYIEDKRSHVEFHSPANRFYEMLSAGLPMVFQPEAFKMLDQAGFNIADDVIDVVCPLPKLIERAEQIGLNQRERWLPVIVEQRKKLPDQLCELWSRYQ